MVTSDRPGEQLPQPLTSTRPEGEPGFPDPQNRANTASLTE